MKTLLSLQYLRAVAALSVVWFHALDRRGLHGFDIGQMGVDIFFVLSGLVMWLISERSGRGAARFFADRIARIAPTYWLATVFVLVLWVIGIRAGLDHPEAWHTLKSFLFVPAEYPGKDKIYPLVIPGWTLNYEMFFYAIFALALFARRWARLAILTGAITGLAVMGAIAKPVGAIGQTYTDPIMLEFLAGVWLGVAWIETKGAGAAPCAVLLASGLALIPLLAWLAPGAPRIIAWGVPALLIVSGAALYERARPVAKLPWLLLLGDASYSIYLWHFPTNPIWDRLAQVMHAPVWLAVPMIAAGGTLFGVIAYLLIERPVRNWIRSRSAHHPVPAAPLAEKA